MNFAKNKIFNSPFLVAFSGMSVFAMSLWYITSSIEKYKRQFSAANIFRQIKLNPYCFVDGTIDTWVLDHWFFGHFVTPLLGWDDKTAKLVELVSDPPIDDVKIDAKSEHTQCPTLLRDMTQFLATGKKLQNPRTSTPFSYRNISQLDRQKTAATAVVRRLSAKKTNPAILLARGRNSLTTDAIRREIHADLLTLSANYAFGYREEDLFTAIHLYAETSRRQAFEIRVLDSIGMGSAAAVSSVPQ